MLCSGIRHRYVVCALAVAGLAASASVQAIPIEQTIHFNTGGVQAPATFPFVSTIDLFDPSLGTLDSVEVLIRTNVLFSGLAPRNLVSAGLPLVPVPYTFQGLFELTFDGPGSALDFSPGPLFLLHVANNGASDLPIAGSWVLEHRFAYDATSDLIGAAFSEPLVAGSGNHVSLLNPGTALINGRRADFTSPGTTNLLLVNLAIQAYEPAFPTGGPAGITPSASGNLTLTYNYTPADPDPPVSVPEPGTSTLLAAALFALLGAGRRQRRRISS